MSNFLFPILSENLIIDYDSKDWYAIPLNPDDIANNNAFKESIKLNNIYVNLQIKRYHCLKKFIVQLMADIEAELVENKISS